MAGQALDFCRAGIIVLMIPAMVPGCGSSAPNDKCSDTNPCRKGMECTKDQACVFTSALALLTGSLPDAMVGDPYHLDLAAAGGLKPYSWSVESVYPWLAVDPQTGALSGTPDAPSDAQAVKITVTDDSYGSGKSVSGDLPLAVANCAPSTTRPCFEAIGSACHQGVKTCIGIHWGNCQVSAPSADLDHCGSACGPCGAVADQCHAGVCQCGDLPACPAGQACCDRQCTPLDSDVRNCGTCGHDCTAVLQNATGPLCKGGACDYTACTAGFLDCDQTRANGCETPIDLQHCFGCNIDCNASIKNATGISCELGGQKAGCNYQTCLLNFGDCDRDLNMPDLSTRNGCETELSTPDNCAACLNNCLTFGDDFDCVLGTDGKYSCGCHDATACLTGEQCCDLRCYAINDARYCGNCQKNCMNDPNGHVCLDSTKSSCGCIGRHDCNSGHYCTGNQLCAVCDQDTVCGTTCTNCSIQSSNTICTGGHCGCSSLSNCAAAEYCDGATSTCAACTVAAHCGPGCSDCAAQSTNKGCFDNGGTYQCGCNSKSDCAATGQFCDNNSCAPCDQNQHCGASCANCTSGTYDHACYNFALCGCFSDNDCGGTRPTCDQTETHRCM